ncbi:hypothetical protein Q5P01_026027 [Channa striata]|uniref:Immunoglobulin domain-containing protein n=1 Tax=Channa striata TaxID=64152 RepID=A0AA88IZ79_CHASR|nr:hypothetical protein Q5P01_026027 [Channa striata]
MHCLLGAFILGAALAAGLSETTLTAKVGEDITLDTGTSELHDDPEIYWTYGLKKNIIVHYENEEINLKKSDRFELNERTGSLTIRSVNISDSGLYQLNIISGSQHNFKLTVVESDPIQTTAGTPQNTAAHRPGGGTQRNHIAAGSDTSSDSDYYRPRRRYATHSGSRDPNTSSHLELSGESEREVIALPQSDESHGEDGSEVEPLDEQELELSQELDAEDESYPDQRASEMAKDPVCKQATRRTKSPRTTDGGRSREIGSRPKRAVKPVVRQTYDEPGKSKDQLISIIHGGVVIKIGGKS